MIDVYIFVFGLIVGSFLNVVVLRLNTNESFVRSRSKCYSCATELKWYELLPIISFIMLHGRCRSCRTKISIQYPIVEALTALIFYFSYLKWLNLYAFGVWDVGILLLWFVFWAIFIVIIVYDIRHKIIPDKLSYLLACVGILGALIYYLDIFWTSFFVGVTLFMFFAFLWFVSHGKWMGLGDAKLFFGVGIFLGWPIGFLALLLSFWVGALVGGLLLAVKKRITLKTEIPFAPFIFSGALIAFFWGNKIFEWYLFMIGI